MIDNSLLDELKSERTSLITKRDELNKRLSNVDRTLSKIDRLIFLVKEHGILI